MKLLLCWTHVSLAAFLAGKTITTADSIGGLRQRHRGSSITTTASSSIEDIHHRHLGLVPLQKPAGRCTEDEPCGRCAGDCQRDSDCQGNLVCYQASGRHSPGDFCATIPGCSDEDTSKTDWCILPQDMPEPNLCRRDTPNNMLGKPGNINENYPDDDSSSEEEDDLALEEVIVETTTSAAACGELRELVFDLTTKINDVDAETIRLEAITDELAATVVVAQPPSPPQSPTSRHLVQHHLHDPILHRRRTQAEENEEEEDGVTDGIQNGVQKLITQQTRLRDRNGQIIQFNSMIRDYIGVWKDENAVLWNSVDALTTEKVRLQTQINELNGNIDNFQDLLDDHSTLNGQLEESTSVLEAEINRLKAENEEIKRLNNEFQSKITDLETVVNQLGNENTIFAGLNENLIVTQQSLTEQVNSLEVENDRLEDNMNELNTTVVELNTSLNRLQGINDELEISISELGSEVITLESEVDDYQVTNTRLETIVSFLNETNSNMNESFDTIIEVVSTQIIALRNVAKETLQNTYQQRVTLWDCAYRDHFGDEVFATNGNIPIPDGEKFNKVVDYISERVLEELCFSKTDFEYYLETIYNEPVYTTNHFISGISSYSTLAFDYYFPDANENENGGGGLSDEDWAFAGYDCEKLPTDKLYSYEEQSS